MKTKRQHYRENQIENLTLKSNVDLTKFNNSRLYFIFLGGELYRVISPLKFYKSEIAQFIFRFLDKRFTIKYITGNCSSPDGYYM